MSIRCPACGAEYDVTLFDFGRRVRCDCGAWVDLSTGHRESVSQSPQAPASSNTGETVNQQEDPTTHE
jgi:hypothetical protein